MPACSRTETVFWWMCEVGSAGVALLLPRHPRLEDTGDLLEGLVLQEPREEQVARVEQREVLLVLDVALRQEPGGLEVEQGGGDQQERGRHLQVPGLAA